VIAHIPRNVDRQHLDQHLRAAPTAATHRLDKGVSENFPTPGMAPPSTTSSESTRHALLGRAVACASRMVRGARHWHPRLPHAVMDTVLARRTVRRPTPDWALCRCLPTTS
jgi:hypothetical protein